MKLNTEKCLNPYFIHNGQVKSIMFYDDSGVIATTGRGWMGSNRIDIQELDDLEFNKRNKLNLTKKEHFYIKTEGNSYNYDVYYNIYIYVPTSKMKVTKSVEEVANDWEHQVNYGMFFYISATFSQHKSTSKFSTMRFMEATFTKIVKKDSQRKADDLIELFKSHNIKLESYRVADMLQDSKFCSDLTNIIERV